MTTKQDIYGDFYKDVANLEGNIMELRSNLDDILYMVQNDDYNNLDEKVEGLDSLIGWIERDISYITNEWYDGKEEEVREELRKEIL